MTVERQLLTLVVVCGWFGLWWLAVRAVFGRYFGAAEWVPVAVLGFAVPLLAADLAATSRAGFKLEPFFVGWALAPVVIDAVWVVRRVARRAANRRPPGGVRLTDRSAGS